MVCMLADRLKYCHGRRSLTALFRANLILFIWGRDDSYLGDDRGGGGLLVLIACLLG